VRHIAPLVLLVLMVTACQSGPGPKSGPDILIASDFPTSYPGPFAVQNEQIVRLAISEQDHIGQFKLGYLPFDDYLGDGPSQAKSVQNVTQMIADARVLGMIGPRTSNIAFADIPVANPSDLVIISPSNTTECLTQPHPFCKAGQPPWQQLSHPNNYFRIAAPEPVAGRAMARYISDSLGVKRAAAFNEAGDQGSLFIKEFGDELARTGGKLVFSQDLPDGTTSFKSFLSQAKAAGAQAIYAITAFDGHVCAARAQMARIFPKDTYFMGSDGMVSWTGGVSEAAKDDECLKDAVGNGEGMLTSTSFIDVTRNTDAASMNIVAAYRKANPTNTDIGTYTMATYDCARLLIDAISRAVKANGGGKPTRAQVVSAVAQAHFQGVTGTYSFDAHGDAVSPMMSIYRVDNGHWVLLKPIDASAK
jgi:branched-chain amino acid transport system substrate-binding protein